MQTVICQRWRERRSSYRPAGEPIDTRRWSVEPIADDSTARSFVKRHHYSASYVAARRRFGLYAADGSLSGVAVVSVPTQPKVLDVLPGDRDSKGLLGRLVLLDHVPANGESWMLARVFDLLRREGWAGLVSFSDPIARSAADGRAVFGGHVGTIYQASNATFLGRSSPRTLRLLPDGTVLHGRAMAKIRKRERGWRYACQELIKHGARPLDANEDAAAWLRRWVAALTRPLRHRGNWKYAWAFSRAGRRELPASLPYPKMIAAPPRESTT